MPAEQHKHGPLYPWPAIEADYVSGLLSPEDICAKYGLNQRQLERARADGEWVQKRMDAVAETTARAIEAAKADVVRDHTQAIKITRSTVLLVARDIQERLRAKKYQASVRDLDRLIRLLQALQNPGWDSQGRPGVTVNVDARQVSARIETVILELQDDQRRKSVPEFLYQEIDNDDHASA